MAGTRLFIGGLSPDLEEANLEHQLSNYGIVLSIDIKDKKDIITGEVVKRFAFATLDGPHASIEKCIYALNGSTLGGSTISVERAQESFIERLKREREARAAGKTLPRPDNSSQTNFSGRYENQNNSTDYSSSFNDNKSTFSTFENDSFSYNYSHKNENKQSNFNDSSHDVEPTYSKDAMDVDLMPSFASYSSAWRDDDELPDQQYEQKDDSADQGPPTTPRPAPKLPVMRRYDPTRPAPQTQPADPAADATEGRSKVTPVVSIAKDLVFSGASGTFSILDMLEGKLDSTKATDEKDGGNEKKASEGTLSESDISAQVASEAPAAVEQESKEGSPKKEKTPRKTKSETSTKSKARKPYVKKQKFFMDAEDACVQEGLTWLYEEISGDVREEFSAVRRSITSLYSGRQRRAAAERRDKGAASLTHEWWWSSRKGNEEGSVEPATLVSEVLSGVASAVRTSFAEEKRSKEGGVKRVVPARPLLRGRGRGRGRGHPRGRGIPWGGRGGRRGFGRA